MNSYKIFKKLEKLIYTVHDSNTIYPWFILRQNQSWLSYTVTVLVA